MHPLARFAFICLSVLAACPLLAETPLSLSLQSRTATNRPTLVKESWLPSRTAIIVCDMWDLHHCKNAVIREGEMAPRFNEVLEKARKEGVLIIHAPSCSHIRQNAEPPYWRTSLLRSASLPQRLDMVG